MARTSIPSAPASPQIARAAPGGGLLCDDFGPATIHPELRRQNTAVPGTVEQGKTYLVATISEDQRRERCAVILLDPKDDAADAAISVVREGRACTVLDIADPRAGSTRWRSTPAPTRSPTSSWRRCATSSTRATSAAIIAVLANNARSTLWDAIRLLSVTDECYASARRRAVGPRGSLAANF